MRRFEEQSHIPLKSQFALHLVLLVALATSVHGQASSHVTSLTTGDGSRFLLLPIGGPPVVHWVVITPAGIAEDPVGLAGLSHATALAALAGTESIGSLDPAREPGALGKVDRLEREVATLRRRGVEVGTELEEQLSHAREAAARFSDPAAWWRLLLTTPATDVRHQLLQGAAILSLSTTTLGLSQVAFLIQERRERALLRGIHSELQNVRRRAAELRAATPLAELRAEVLALAFSGHPFGRLWARRGPAGPLSGDVAMQVWRRTQRGERGLHVLVGGFDLADVESTLGEVFRDSDLNRDPMPEQFEVPTGDSIRRSAVPGGSAAAIAIGLPLPATFERGVLEAVTRWIAGGEDSFLAHGLREAGYTDFRVEGLAPFPSLGSTGLLLIEVEIHDRDSLAADHSALEELLEALLVAAEEQGPLAADLQPIINDMETRHTTVRGAADSIAYELAVQCGLLGQAPEDVLGPFKAPTRSDCMELIGTLGWRNRIEVVRELVR